MHIKLFLFRFHCHSLDVCAHHYSLYNEHHKWNDEILKIIQWKSHHIQKSKKKNGKVIELHASSVHNPTIKKRWKKIVGRGAMKLTFLIYKSNKPNVQVGGWLYQTKMPIIHIFKISVSYWVSSQRVNKLNLKPPCRWSAQARNVWKLHRVFLWHCWIHDHIIWQHCPPDYWVSHWSLQLIRW